MQRLFYISQSTVFSLWLISFGVPAAGVEVYRCVGEEGAVTFQQIPCGWIGGDKLQVRSPKIGFLKPKSNPPGQKHKVPGAGLGASGMSQTGAGGGDQSKQRRCWEREKRRDRLQRKLRAGYSRRQGEAWRRQRDELEDYLARFCR